MEQTFVISVPNDPKNKKYFDTLDDGIQLIFEYISAGYKEINGNKTTEVIADLKTLFNPNRKRLEGYKLRMGIHFDPEYKTFCVFTETIKL
jgi:hypothetical protein